MMNNTLTFLRMTRSLFLMKSTDSESGLIMLITSKRPYPSLLTLLSPLKKSPITSTVYLIFTSRLLLSPSLNPRRKKSLLLILRCKLKVKPTLIINKIITIIWTLNSERLSIKGDDVEEKLTNSLLLTTL